MKDYFPTQRELIKLIGKCANFITHGQSIAAIDVLKEMLSLLEEDMKQNEANYTNSETV